MAAGVQDDMLMSDSSIVERHGWSHTMNLMLATLTAADRYETYALEADTERQLRTPTIRAGGLRRRLGWAAGHLRLTGRGAGA